MSCMTSHDPSNQFWSQTVVEAMEGGGGDLKLHDDCPHNMAGVGCFVS